jgi:hypothetical protein
MFVYGAMIRLIYTSDAQVLLVYDVLPVELVALGGVAKTSLLIPPLLALTYCLLGGVFPSLLEKVGLWRPCSHDACSPCLGSSYVAAEQRGNT